MVGRARGLLVSGELIMFLGFKNKKPNLIELYGFVLFFGISEFVVGF